MEPLSRLATHNAMGPWFVRNPARPFQPGCSFETLKQLIDRGQVDRDTVIRGPSTRQFWNVARRVQGVAHLLGVCHHCGTKVDSAEHGCHKCGTPFTVLRARDSLGLPEIRPLPPAEGSPAETSRTSDDEPAGNLPADSLPTTMTPPPIVPTLASSAPSSAAGGALSSFATDEELRGQTPGLPAASDAARISIPVGPRRVSARPDPSATPVSSAWGTVETSPPDAPADWVTSAATRSMQRRIAHQRRTIRWLGVCGAAMIVVLVAVIALPQLQSPSVQSQADAADSAERLASSDPETKAPVEAPVEAIAASVLPADQHEVQVVEEAPIDSVASSIPAGYQQALDYIAVGEDTDRSTADRLTAYRSALALLAEIDAEKYELLEDIEDRIAMVKQEIDRLDLALYFDEPT